MFVAKKFLTVLLIILTSSIIIQSCGKKEEPQTFIPPDQQTVDKEKEQKEREEFERLKRLRDGITDSASASDTSSSATDSSKAGDSKKENKNFVQKEKELNKRLDNPTVAVADYLEFLKRGTSEGGNFELNMKKASQQWTNSDINRFKSNYKNTKKIVILEEPKIISQDGNNATVEVKILKTDRIDSEDKNLEMTVKYNLIADGKGKWKIKDNVVVKK